MSEDEIIAEELSEFNQLMLGSAVHVSQLGGQILRKGIEMAYEARGFPSDDPLLLFLGLAEEMGELAELINIDTRPAFHLSERKLSLLEDVYGNVAAEIGDILTYVGALMNYYDVDPVFTQWFRERSAQLVQRTGDTGDDGLMDERTSG